MLQSFLHHLSDPLNFGVFSLVMGIAYVAIWAFFLNELAQKKRRVLAKRIKNEFDYREKGIRKNRSA